VSESVSPGQVGDAGGKAPARLSAVARVTSAARDAYAWLERRWSEPPWLAPIVVIAPFIAAGVYVLAFNPTDAEPDPTGPCLIKTLTGLDCPGCGGTRMFWYLLHGDLVHAAQYHVMGLVGLLFLAYAYTAWVFERLLRRRLPLPRDRGVLYGGVFIAVWVAFAVARNLPWEPFSLLYVT
jgi:hypothetical protein